MEKTAPKIEFTEARGVFLREENKRWPLCLVSVPREEWAHAFTGHCRPFAVWRSRDFLVQGYTTRDQLVVRLSVLRTVVVPGVGFADGISWENLQKLKSEAGYGDHDAVEVYPPDSDVVNDANMRHLFVFVNGHRLPFVWRKNGGGA